MSLNYQQSAKMGGVIQHIDNLLTKCYIYSNFNIR